MIGLCIAENVEEETKVEAAEPKSANLDLEQTDEQERAKKGAITTSSATMTNTATIPSIARTVTTMAGNARITAASATPESAIMTTIVAMTGAAVGAVANITTVVEAYQEHHNGC